MKTTRRDLLRLRLPVPPKPAPVQIVAQDDGEQTGSGCSAERGYDETPPPWATSKEVQRD